jgi:hypothetical protein
MTLSYERRVIEILREKVKEFYRIHLQNSKGRNATLSPYLTTQEVTAVCAMISAGGGRVLRVQKVTINASDFYAQVRRPRDE